MADTPRITDADLNDQQLEQALVANGSAFSFFQAYRLLRQIVARRGEDPRHAIRVRPQLDMGRAQSSVVGIRRLEPEDVAEEGSQARYEIETSFLGLYGTSSPLPNFYTEDLIFAEQEDHTGARAFLDLFQQRIYDLYLGAMEQYRPLYDMTESTESRFKGVLWSMVGLRAPALREQLPDSDLFLRYLGLFARPQRSASGLQVMLEDFTGCSARVDQCVERQVRIPNRLRLSLGENSHCLGETSVLGCLAREFSGRIHLVLGPMSHERFSSLMNVGENWPLLVSLISYYLKAPVECDLTLLLRPTHARPIELGNAAWGQLGQNTWLYGAHENGDEETSDALVATIAIA